MSAVPGWGHDELHQDLLYNCKCVLAGLIDNFVGTFGHWELSMSYSIWSFFKGMHLAAPPLHMLLLLIHISETYLRIDPKHHAKPPSGEMHLSHCRALPFPYFQFQGFPSQRIHRISRSADVRIFHDTLLLFCSVESPAMIAMFRGE